MILKVLSSEMDLAESGLILWESLNIKRRLAHLLAIRILIANAAIKFITP